MSAMSQRRADRLQQQVIQWYDKFKLDHKAYVGSRLDDIFNVSSTEQVYKCDGTVRESDSFHGLGSVDEGDQIVQDDCEAKVQRLESTAQKLTADLAECRATQYHD